MIVGNLTAHCALAMSQWVAHSHVPLQIMMAPLRTQAGAVKVYTKFIEFLARRVVALQEKLGPGISAVNLESEAAEQSVPAGRGRSRSASPHSQVSAFPSGFKISSSSTALPSGPLPRRLRLSLLPRMCLAPTPKVSSKCGKRWGSDNDDDKPDQGKKGQVAQTPIRRPW